ncbi:MAG: dihydroneopterin aldolase [Arenicella sp.]|jgi:dihydroneopterin aldolase
MDIIYLHGLKCECTIGVWQWEKAITQTLILDIELAADAGKAAENDDLKDALDYQAITQSVQAYAKENAFELIETLAERIATLILDQFSTPWVRIKLDKGQAVKGVKNVGVIIERGKRP